MSSPGTCPRCRQWFADLAPGAVCETCARAGSQRTTTADPDRVAPTATGDADTSPDQARALPRNAPDPPPECDLEAKLGAGGMGQVYLARERATGRQLAVKYLHFVSHPSSRERFRVEVQALANVRHSNIVQVFAVALDGREPYFTMEHLPGGSLANRLKAAGPLPPVEAAGLIESLARAAAAAHDAGILHRDIKPSNVLLDADGTPKLADFGLAKWVDRDEQLTASGSLIGTPSYMAPEQAARRHDDIGPATDVYSLGATLYECLAGRPPFKGPTPEATTELVLKAPPVPPRSLKPEIPTDLEAVCLKCLEKRGTDRYPSPIALAADLGRFLRGDSTVARPLPRTVRAWRRVKRNWRSAAAVGVLLAAVAFGMAIRAWEADTKRLTVEDEAANLRRNLAAGRPFTVLGESGEPRYYNWWLGKTAFTESWAGDKACSYESILTSILELVPDPGIDHYRVSADIRILRPAASEYPANLVGVYFGHVSASGPGGRTAHALLAAGYKDLLDPKARKAGVAHATVLLRKVVIVQGDDVRNPEPYVDGVSLPIRFPPSEARHGEWRRVRIERTAAGVRVLWSVSPQDNQEAGDWKLLAETADADLNRLYNEMQATLDAKYPNSGIRLPSPPSRPTVGLWASTLALSVRKVIVEPLP
jgi:serine/threonine-protein kinase